MATRGPHYPVLTGTPQYQAYHSDDDLTNNTGQDFVKIKDVDDIDASVPCPWCEQMFGTTMIYQCCCCCFWNDNDRRKCAIGILYSRYYLLLYVCIIVITVTLVVFDIATGFDRLDKEAPEWFVGLDITCVVMMAIDVIVQIFANPRAYWKSAANIFDFIVVSICVIGVPVYFYIPQSEIVLTIVLLLRFAAQLLRIIMIFRHQKQRSAYIDTTKNDIVDFSTFQDSADIAKNQGIADDGRLIIVPNSNTNSRNTSNLYIDNNNNNNNINRRSSDNLAKNIKDMTPEWTVINKKDLNQQNNNDDLNITFNEKGGKNASDSQITPFHTPRTQQIKSTQSVLTNATSDATTSDSSNTSDSHQSGSNENENENKNENDNYYPNLKPQTNYDNSENVDENSSLMGAVQNANSSNNKNGNNNKNYESFSDIEKDKEGTAKSWKSNVSNSKNNNNNNNMLDVNRNNQNNENDRYSDNSDSVDRRPTDDGGIVPVVI